MKTWSVLLMAGLACQVVGAVPKLPALKPGMWQVTMQHQQPPSPAPVTVLQCVDRSTSERMLLSPFSGVENCSAPLVKRNGASYIVQTRCTMEEKTTVTKALLSGNFSSHYEGAFEAHHDLPSRPQEPAKRFEARWLGACKPGMKPADLELPNRITINLKEKAAANAKHDLDHDHSAPGHKH